MKAGARHLLTLALVLLGLWFYETMRPVGQAPGILAPDPPRLTPVEGKPPVFERSAHVLTGLARFQAKARVLSLERYGRDRQARIAPLDLALGWGVLSDTATLKAVDVAQTERRVLYQSYDPKLPDEQVETSILNVHVIGANAEVDKRLGELRQGHIVELEGWLVEAVGADGWRWRGETRSRSPALPGTLLWIQRLEAS
ncbi:MAG: hypothetical protein IT531_11590 [Burkholderiales bacterium]|nr:hypothetical protein [Burkholderiales bacterium]